MNITPRVIDLYRPNPVPASDLEAARQAGIREVIHKAIEGDAQPARCRATGAQADRLPFHAFPATSSTARAASPTLVCFVEFPVGTKQ